ERAEDAKAARRVRIALRELTRGLGTHGLGASAGPRDEETLLGGHAVARRDRVRRQQLGERAMAQPHTAEIGDSLALDALAVEVQPWLDLEGRVLAVDAGGARLEARAIGVAPPARRPPLGVEVRAAGIERMGEIVADADANAAVE